MKFTFDRDDSYVLDSEYVVVQGSNDADAEIDAYYAEMAEASAREDRFAGFYNVRG